MIDFSHENIERFLRQVFGDTVRLERVGRIGSLDEQGMKDFGYGKPLLVTFERGGRTEQAVISTMKGDTYGHQNWWDRARILMCQYDTGSRMERHVRPLALGYVDKSGRAHAVNEPQEFFVVSEKLEGHDYFLDLERIRGGDVRPDDEKLVRGFASWLARVHSNKLDEPDRYIRRIRNTVGDCECIFGIIDGYPDSYDEFPPERFEALEKRLIDWRWKLKSYTHRLSAVHGDFHPWNVLVREGADFSVLDRSRGEWGEPGDDVSTMALNLMLFGIYDAPRLTGPFERLYMAFWEQYLADTNDTEMLEVLGPFFVFRGLVIASPQWYPNHPLPVRRGLFRFLENVLEDQTFDWKNINKYME